MKISKQDFLNTLWHIIVISLIIVIICSLGRFLDLFFSESEISIYEKLSEVTAIGFLSSFATAFILSLIYRDFDEDIVNWEVVNIQKYKYINVTKFNENTGIATYVNNGSEEKIRINSNTIHNPEAINNTLDAYIKKTVYTYEKHFLFWIIENIEENTSFYATKEYLQHQRLLVNAEEYQAQLNFNLKAEKNFKVIK